MKTAGDTVFLFEARIDRTSETLYDTGATIPAWVEGVRWTIKDGVEYFSGFFERAVWDALPGVAPGARGLTGVITTYRSSWMHFSFGKSSAANKNLLIMTALDSADIDLQPLKVFAV